MDRGKREALLAAALPAVLESGAAGLTLDPILAAAGAGTGTFYHHFAGGKAQLVSELYEQVRREYVEGVTQVLRRNRDAQAGVAALVHHHVRWFGAEPDRARILLLHRGAALPEGGRQLLRLLSEWAAAVGLPRQPADQLYALWLGPVLEWGHVWLGGAGGGTEVAADRFARAAWTALSGD